jgi:hypothetical protein
MSGAMKSLGGSVDRWGDKLQRTLKAFNPE